MGPDRGSEHQQEAWLLTKWLATDTQAEVALSTALKNVPTTLPALHSPDLESDANFKTFLDIFSNPNSATTPASPNGGAYQLTLQDVGYAYESGKETDLQGSLDKAAKQIDTDIDRAR